jgi:hypothetical protein
MGDGKVLIPKLVLSENPKEVASYFPNGINGNGAEVVVGIELHSELHVELARSKVTDPFAVALAGVLATGWSLLVLGKGPCGLAAKVAAVDDAREQDESCDATAKQIPARQRVCPRFFHDRLR